MESVCVASMLVFVSEGTAAFGTAFVALVFFTIYVCQPTGGRVAAKVSTFCALFVYSSTFDWFASSGNWR